MKYEVVNLKEKKVAGLSIRTKNSDQDMYMKIAGLWNDLFNNDIYEKIQGKVNNKTIGMYSDYESDVNGEYQVTVGAEINPSTEIPEGCITKIILEGKYAKFIVKGNMNKVVEEFWQELWKMNLDRAYKCDFEEYQNSSIENAEIHMYISIK